MGKTNGATTTKSKAKESPKDKTPAKSDRKVEKVEKADSKKSEKGSNGSSRAPTPKATLARPVAPVITYKCPFPADELVKWRQILLAKRHEVTDDIAGLVKDAM